MWARAGTHICVLRIGMSMRATYETMDVSWVNDIHLDAVQLFLLTNLVWTSLVLILSDTLSLTWRVGTVVVFGVSGLTLSSESVAQSAAKCVASTASSAPLNYKFF